MLDQPPCAHPYDGWFVNRTPLTQAGFLVADFIEGAPGRRGEDLTIARRAGQRWQKKFYDARVQTIVLWALKEDEFGNVRGGAERNVDRLKRLFGGGLEQVELTRRLTLPFERVSTRVADVELVSALEGNREVLTTAGTYVNFALDLRFADPFWYEPVNRLTGVGDYGPTVLWNPGTVTAERAQLRIYGPAVEPTISFEPAGTTTTFDVTIDYGDWIDVDAETFTAVDQDGVSIAGSINRAQVPILQIAPGRNTVSLSDGTCDVAWRPAFL